MALDGQRVLVVGASSGLGRSIAGSLAGRSARVALAARRLDRVQDAAARLGSGALGVRCDVTDPAAVDAAVAEVVDAFGGLDGLVYAAAQGPLVRLADAGADVWRSTFDTNVIGAALVTKACLPHLEAAHGRAVYLSSVSASETPPWPGLGVYAASKAALDKQIEAWSGEHPGVGFTRLVSGDSAGGPGDCATEFTAGWDPELADTLLAEWFARGYLSGHLVDVEDLGAVVAAVLESGAHVPSVVVRPRPPAPDR